jgi:hypothetical protein
MDMQHRDEHEALSWTSSTVMDLQHEHEHAAWTWTCSMDNASCSFGLAKGI